MTLEIAQTAALSLALSTVLPVEISLWTLPRFMLMDLRVCSATIALLFVRMLDMKHVPLINHALRGLSPNENRWSETVFLTNAIAVV
ncbi:hypothetical protein [Roseobacter sp. EG26]|uniref:hypothetical protein n=1 Tax=Roseobacter sp. EG26 TaxID=3412477 RepID=UPI003CE477B6